MRPARGFTLIEVLVAVAIFAAMAALAWGGLDAVLRARQKLDAAQDEFTLTLRSVGALERDLRAAAPRPIRGNYGEPVPALRGDTEHVEFTRLGFAHPESEARSRLERVSYELDGKTLRRGRYAVLDRAAGTAPVWSTLRGGVESLRLRYLDPRGRWLEAWPDRDATQIDALPRAVEFRLQIQGLGDVRRVVELPGTPAQPPAAGAPP